MTALRTDVVCATLCLKLGQIYFNLQFGGLLKERTEIYHFLSVINFRDRYILIYNLEDS